MTVLRPSSKSRSRAGSLIALLGGLLLLALPRAAHAQACCVGGTVLTPGRLNLHEEALVGVQLKATDALGSFDSQGNFVHPSKGAREVDFEEDLIGSLRVLERGQVTLLVPVLETYRRATDLTGFITDGGGGIGDLQVSARWDATIAGASLRIPGIAVLASVTLPTGVPPELATHRLSADSTGMGTVRGGLGISLEQTFGKVLVDLTGSGTVTSARTYRGVHVQLGPSFNAFAALGYSFEPGPILAVTASYTAELDGKTDGMTTSAHTQLRLGLSLGHVFNDAWRMQATFFGDPPAPQAGQNQPVAGVGLSATFFHTW
jgi:hypothetical protein